MSNIYDDLADGTDVDATWLQPLPTAVGRIASVGFRPLQRANYVIFKSGSTYYRRDGSDGEIDDSNSNAATLINNAITALGGNGGLIYLKQGTYTLTTAITQTAQVAIVGANNASTYLDFSSGTSNGITTAAGTKRWMHISDLTLKLNDKVGILWQNITQSSIERVRILNPSIGVKLSGNDGTASAAIWNSLRSVIVDNPSDAGIRLTGVAGNGQANGNFIQAYIYNLQGGAPVANSIGIDVDVGDHNTIFAQIQQMDVGIEFDNADYNRAFAELDKVTAFTTEVNFTANSNTNKVHGENITNAKITDNGSGNKVYPNYHNGGAATNVSDGGTIAHGLPSTPTYALVTPSTASEMASVTAKDGTNITVAIKKDDGTAGTQQTIYWRAWI